jgi:lipoprotein-anchoring transpeptidase ErfK/SrfK
LDQYVTRSTLNTNGTVVSNGRVGTKWTSGGTFVSGYSQRNDTYDRTLAQNPPPFTPTTSDDFKINICINFTF